MIGVSAFGVPRPARNSESGDSDDRRNTMAAALIAVRHNRKKSAHLGEPEVNLCEKVPTVDECIKVGNVERLTHRLSCGTLPPCCGRLQRCLDSVCPLLTRTASGICWQHHRGALEHSVHVVDRRQSLLF